MQALRFDGSRLALAEMPTPMAAGETLVRVNLSGICNTDLEIVRGYAGFEGTLGHEFVGTVERSDEKSELAGRRVVGEINAGCGTCARCRAGDPRHCPARTVLGIVGRDGCHAEYLTLPARNLIAVPDAVSDADAVFAEPLAAALGIGEQIEIDLQTEIAVIGDGKLGLLCALTLAVRPARVTLIGKHESKLSIAADAGIDTTLISEIVDRAKRKFDIVIEASGSESGFATAVDIVRPRGKIVLKSTFQGRPTWPASRIVVDEITVVGSRCGRMAPALELLERRVLDLRPLISDEFPLKDGVRAFDRANEKGILKVLLRPSAI